MELSQNKKDVAITQTTNKLEDLSNKIDDTGEIDKTESNEVIIDNNEDIKTISLTRIHGVDANDMPDIELQTNRLLEKREHLPTHVAFSSTKEILTNASWKLLGKIKDADDARFSEYKNLRVFIPKNQKEDTFTHLVINLYPHEDCYPKGDYTYFKVNGIRVRFTGATAVTYNSKNEHFYFGCNSGSYRVQNWKSLGKVTDPLESKFNNGTEIFIDERVAIPRGGNESVVIGEFMTK